MLRKTNNLQKNSNKDDDNNNDENKNNLQRLLQWGSQKAPSTNEINQSQTH